jgi:hypothetical protein
LTHTLEAGFQSLNEQLSKVQGELQQPILAKRNALYLLQDQLAIAKKL